MADLREGVGPASRSEETLEQGPDGVRTGPRRPALPLVQQHLGWRELPKDAVQGSYLGKQVLADGPLKDKGVPAKDLSIEKGGPLVLVAKLAGQGCQATAS